MRTRGRKDQNHDAIVKALRQAGASVQSLASVGNGCPDLLVARAGWGLFLLEVKDGSLPLSKRMLTRDEKDWIDKWPLPVHVVYSVAQALRIIGVQSKLDPFEELAHVAKSAMEKAKE